MVRPSTTFSVGSPRAVLSRRDILAGVAGGAAIGIAPVSGRELSKIGLQLYTVRDLLKADFEGTLRKVARLGYREVEFAGILGPNVRRTRKLCWAWVSLRRRCISTTAACETIPDHRSTSLICLAAGLSCVHGWTSWNGRQSMIGSGFVTD